MSSLFRFRRCALALTLLGLAALTGCGSGGNASNYAYFVYAASDSGFNAPAVSSTIQRYAPDSGGDLNANGALFPAGTGVAAVGLTVSPTGRYAAFSASDVASDSSTYRLLAVSADGSLNTTGVSFGSGSETPNSVAFSPNGRFIYAVNTTGAPAHTETVQQYALAADGTLTPTGTPLIFSGDIVPEGIVLTPDGSRAYVLEANNATSTGQIQPYTIGSNGTLALSGTPVTAADGQTPFGLAFTAGGGSAYALLASTGDHIAGNTFVGTMQEYSLGSGGTLNATGSPIAAGAHSAFFSLAFAPNGTTAYASEVNVSTQASAIQEFQVGSGSTLSPIGTPVTFPTGTLVLGLAVHL